MIKTNVIQIEKDQKQTIFIVDNSIAKLLDKHIIIDVPHKLPMIVKPKEYYIDEKTGIHKLGGYLLNDIEIINSLIIKNSNLREQSTFISNSVINMVNNMSSVGFKINIEVLNFILENGYKFNLLLDSNLINDLESKLKKNSDKINISEMKKLESFNSQKRLELNILGISLIYKNVPEFYIPVRIDNRGRVYCMSEYLNYQSTELAKPLLVFSKPNKLTKLGDSIKYLKIYGANCFGNKLDKKSG